jgi:hypothetical protein
MRADPDILCPVTVRRSMKVFTIVVSSILLSGLDLRFQVLLKNLSMDETETEIPTEGTWGEK